MPWVVTNGEVHNGTERYHVGDVVPFSVVDDVLAHSDGLQWRDDVSEPATQSEGYAAMTNRELRALIVSRGVKPPVVANKAALVAILEADDERNEEALEA